MKKKFGQFILKLTILSLIVWVISLILGKFVLRDVIPPVVNYIIILFYMTTAGVHYVLLRITELNPRKFVSYFMLATFAKLMTYMIVIVAYVFVMKKEILAFVLSFFILYIIFTVFEVTSILSQTKDQNTH